jgi:hypothetical protein
LVDNDWITVDNIGRHLLGFESVGQQKSFAVAQYLQQYRPDREVKAIKRGLQQLTDEEINGASAVFVCTGDIMSEKWLLGKMEDGVITQPTFILWLEAYGISGIMLYVNPEDKESIGRLLEKSNDCFMDYCLISREEYKSREKLVSRDAGCNGSYAHYSANDVTMFLSAIFPYIDQLMSKPEESKIYRWIGNIEIAAQKNISLVSSLNLSKHMLQILPL